MGTQQDENARDKEWMKTLRQYLDKMGKQLTAALPRHIPQERFLRVMLTTIQRDRHGKLVQCTLQSILGAMMEAAQDGLELDGVHAALVPYKDQGVMQAHYQQMYRGMIARARRSGDVSNVRARPVYEGDVFEYEDGLEPKLRHVRNLDGEQGDERIRCFYSVVDFKDGSKSFEIMTRSEVDKIRNSSKAYQYDPEGSTWATNYPEMGCKTVARRHLKWCPMASDFQRSITRDEMLEQGKAVLALPEAHVFDTMPEEVTAPSKAASMAEDVRRRTAEKKGGKPKEAQAPQPAPAPAKQPASPQKSEELPFSDDDPPPPGNEYGEV